MTKPDIFLDFSIVPAQVSPLHPRNLDFPFFSSSIAHLEPKLQRFEDWSIFVRMCEQQILIKFQNTLSRVLDEQ